MYFTQQEQGLLTEVLEACRDVARYELDDEEAAADWQEVLEQCKLPDPYIKAVCVPGIVEALRADNAWELAGSVHIDALVAKLHALQQQHGTARFH